MPCPFPGMDPYIEQASVWPDFHNSLIAGIRGVLQPLLSPRYAAVTQDRVFVVASDRPIHPDVSIRASTSQIRTPETEVAVLTPSKPKIFKYYREEIREPLIEIVKTTGKNAVVTAIEVLSPDNKAAGKGRKSYLSKRDDLAESEINLVEIDLLRVGKPTISLSKRQRTTLDPHHYLVAVTRRWPALHEIYAIHLSQSLPVVSVPLGSDDGDVPLDLQAAFNRCWDEGGYLRLLDYAGPPPGKMSPEDAEWCAAKVTEAGLRAGD